MTLSVLTFNTCSRTITFQSSSYFNELAARRTRFVPARLLPLPVLETEQLVDLDLRIPVNLLRKKNHQPQPATQGRKPEDLANWAQNFGPSTSGSRQPDRHPTSSGKVCSRGRRDDYDHQSPTLRVSPAPAAISPRVAQQFVFIVVVAGPVVPRPIFPDGQQSANKNRAKKISAL